MAKKSQVDRITENIEREIEVLQAALDRIRQQPQPAPRKARKKPTAAPGVDAARPRAVNEG